MKESSRSQVRVTYTDRPDVAFTGDIRNLSTESLRVTLDKPLMEEAAVIVEFSPGCVENGVVGHCNRYGDGFYAAINFVSRPSRSARTEERTKLSETVVVFLLDSEANGRSFQATTIDISPSGLGLNTPEAVPVGSLLRVERKNSVLLGEVRHCAQVGAQRFRVGMALERRIDRNDVSSGWLRNIRSRIRQIFY